MFSFFKKKKPTPLVVPRIKHTNFVEAMNAIPGMTDNSRPVTEPIVGDLLLTYAIDMGHSYMAVTPGVLKDHSLTQSDMRALAMANGLTVLRSLTVQTNGVLHEMTADENMVACSILFPELWQQVEQEINAKPIVSFPHRDSVLYTSAESPHGIEELRKIIADVDFNETHALSKLLFQPTPDGWTVIDS